MNQANYLTRFQEITEQMFELTMAKNSDYANEGNAFANFELIDTLSDGGISTESGFAVRMSDKLQRVVNLLRHDANVESEKIEDTLKDLAIYSILFLIYMEEKNATNEIPVQELPF